MSQSQRVRAFIALPVHADVRQHLREWVRPLRERLAASFVRWVRPDHIHLTLRFLGAVPAEQLADIAVATRSACGDVSELNLAARGIGCFPDSRSPRVVWADLTGDVAQLRQLHQALTEHTAGFGQPPDDRGFQPHLTLGRIKVPDVRSKEALARRIAESADTLFGQWRVSRVELMKSVLGPQGSEYSVIATVPLRPP